MLTENTARQFAEHWLRAWNSHDLDGIMSHYGQEIVLTSPIAKKLLNLPSGRVAGKDALRSYFMRGLDAYPELRFELIEVMWGLDSMVLYYKNQAGVKAGEFMQFDADGKVIKVVAHYNG